MAIVAVMLMPQPSPVRARSRKGSQPASSTKWKTGTAKISRHTPSSAKRRPPRTSIIRPKKGRTAMATTLKTPMIRPIRLWRGPNFSSTTGNRKKSETAMNRKK